MKHLAAAVVVGLAVYLVLNLLFGPAGSREMSRLSSQRAKLEANLAELKRINRDLEADVEALRSDPEEIRMRARRLGYYATDEWVIRFEGYDGGAQPRSPGREVRARRSRTDASSLIRSAAVSAGLLTGIVLLFTERLRQSRVSRREKRESEETGPR